MRTVIQRVSRASVSVDGALVAAIDQGILVLIGIGHDDQEADALALAHKIAHLRIFADAAGRFDRSLLEHGGAALVVSQFTLYSDTRRGRRPGFSDAAAPALAAPLVDAFAAALRAVGVPAVQGIFGAHMEVSLCNDGPVTLILESSPRTAAGR
jgi:D-tyrosyl-tRNA(Tyr) deacylase